MNYIKFLIGGIFFVLSVGLFSQDKYIQHIVIRGENLFNLSQKYQVSKDSILKLNINIKDEKIFENEVILIPIADFKKLPEKELVAKNNPIKIKDVKYDTLLHTVEKGETLYSLSRKYKMIIPEVILLNKGVEQGITVGHVMKFLKKPESNTFLKGKVVDTLKKRNNVSLNNLFKNIAAKKFYIILEKETFYGISKKLNIFMQDLKRYNPNIDILQLKIGDTLFYDSTAVRSDNINNIETEKKSDSTKIEIDSIFVEPSTTINPPWKLQPIHWNYPTPLKDIDPIKIEKGLRIALLLPFFENTTTSVFANLKPAIHYFLGIQLAIQELQKIGLKVYVDVFDTKKDSAVIAKWISQKILEPYDLILGPLYTNNLEFLARHLKHKTIISPFSDNINTNIPNIIQTELSKESQLEYIYQYVEDIVTPQDKILIAQENITISESRFLKHRLDKALVTKAVATGFLRYDEKNLLNKQNILPYLTTKGINYILVSPKTTETFKHNILNSLHYNSENYKCIFISSLKDVVPFEESVDEMNALKFSQFFTSKKIQYQIPKVKKLLALFKEKNHFYADYFVLKGFDVMYDIANMYFKTGDFLENLTSTKRFGTTFVFKYKKNPSGSISNHGVLLLKYQNIIPDEFDIVDL